MNSKFTLIAILLFIAKASFQPFFRLVFIKYSKQFLQKTLLLILLFDVKITNAQTTWTGSVGTNWTNQANWSAGVPDASDDVTISAAPNNPNIRSTAIAFVKSLEVQSGAILTIEKGASLTANGTKFYGVSTSICFSNEGTVENNGLIILGNISNIGQFGLYNSANFTNKSDGEIKIDRALNTGLFNQSSSFINDGKVTIGANSIIFTGIKTVFAYFFINNATGEINIDNTTNTAFVEDFSVSKNYGKITIGAISSDLSLYGISSDGAFLNYAGGEIKIDKISSIALRNIESEFFNFGKVIIGSNSSAGQYGITNAQKFVNESSGEINIDRTALSNIYNEGSIINRGKIMLGSNKN
jgi:hypothetical protein